jgi:tetratricopeptide (TPR) repeat protein
MQTMKQLKQNMARIFSKIAAAFGIVLTALFLQAASAGDFKTDFEQANQLYDQGKYDAARKLYQSVIDGGHYSPEAFYNLGNTEFRLNDPGQAILNYERSLALAPNNPETKANLIYVRDQAGVNVPARDWRDRIIADLPVNVYAWTAACAGWIGVFVLAVILLRLRRDTLAPWLMVFCCTAVLAYALFAIYQSYVDRSLAIVTTKAEARFAPADNSTLAATLPAGSRIWIRERRGLWVYCTLPDSNRAWLPSASVSTVRLNDS